MSGALTICKVLAEPTELTPNTLYLILNESNNDVRLMVTDALGDDAFNVVSVSKVDPMLYYMLNRGSSMEVTPAKAPPIADAVSMFMMGGGYRSL